MDKQSVAKSIVQVTIEIRPKDCWPADVQVSQIYQQAGRETVQMLENLMQTHQKDFRIIGKPKVTAVYIDEE